MSILCILITSELLYSRSCTVIIRCALRGTLLRCPVCPRVISRVHSPWFSFTYCYHDDVFVGRVGLHVHTLSSCWCYIRDLYGHCYMVLFPLDDDLMMTWWFLLLLKMMTLLTTTADYGLCLPNFSTTPTDVSWTMFRWFRRVLDDVAVMSLLRCRWWCLLSPFRPAAFLSSRWWSAVFVCQSSFVADEHLLRRWWVSRLQPLSPSELDKQFVSDRWTLEDDDDLAVSTSPDLTSLNLTLYIVMNLVYIALCYQNILSVSLSVTRRVAASRMSVFIFVFTRIYSVFNLYLLCIYPLISVPLCTFRCY